MIKRFLPRSLFARFLLIILIPTILVQVVTIYVFYNRHWESVSRHIKEALIGEISFVTNQLVDMDLESRDNFLSSVNNNMYLKAEIFPEPYYEYRIDSFIYGEVNSIWSNLKQRINGDIKAINYTDDASYLVIYIKIPDNILKITVTSKRINNPSNYIFIMWMVGTSILLFFVSIIFMRNQVRPITKLAKAAEQFGKGIVPKDFKSSGAYEVRKASQAFLKMTSKINRQVEQRTEMLAGVSHDLKTPLTRIKLQLALMEHSKNLYDLEADVTLMQNMVQEYIDFTKSQQSGPAIEVDITSKLRKIVKRYAKHHPNIEYHIPKDEIIIATNVTAFKRAVSNIIDNALKYGENVKISLEKQNAKVLIIIDDDGIGIPEDKRELVFKPFYRIDESRGLEKGGTGLGLSIAKDFVLSYGGSISLLKSDLGGLKAIISLNI